MRICCSLPVPLSFADTLTMPLASMSKVTSICGIRHAVRTECRQGQTDQAACCPQPFHARPGRPGWSRHPDCPRRSRRPGLLGRDRRVAVNQAGKHTAQRLDTQRQRGHVEQQHILYVALPARRPESQHQWPPPRPGSRPVRFACRRSFSRSPESGHAGHAADQNDFVNFVWLEAGILERCLAGINGPRNEVFDQRFQLGAGQLHIEMLRARGISRDEGQVHFGLRARTSSILAFSAASFRRCSASLSSRRFMP
jgi:hypothetical protein